MTQDQGNLLHISVIHVIGIKNKYLVVKQKQGSKQSKEFSKKEKCNKGDKPKQTSSSLNIG